MVTSRSEMELEKEGGGALLRSLGFWGGDGERG